MKNFYSLLILLVTILNFCNINAQTITSVSPNVGNIGETITVGITGQGINFAQGTSTVQAVLTDSALINIVPTQLQIVDATHLNATFTFTYLNNASSYSLFVSDAQGNTALLQSAFTINNATTAFAINNITPNTAHTGQILNVSISGQGASFGQGTSTTQVTLINGSNSINAYNISVVNSSNINAQFSLNNSTTAPGAYSVQVFNSIDGYAQMVAPFIITTNPQPPSILNIAPNNAVSGNTISVSLSGQNTHFGQGTATTQVWFSQGSSTLYTSSVNITSATNLTANLVVPNGAAVGQYNANIENNVDGNLSLVSAFTVNANPNAPALINVTPNSAAIGTTIPVTISGQNTHFLQGTGTVSFSQGTSTLYGNVTSIASETQLNADIYIPNNASLGNYQLITDNTIDGITVLNNAFTVTPMPCSNLNANIISQPCTNIPAQIFVSGGTPPYNVTIASQNYLTFSNNFSFMPPAIGTYQLTNVSDANGCSTNLQNSFVTLNALTGNLTTNISSCLPMQVSLANNIVSSSAITSIYYDYNDGISGYDSTHFYSIPGIYHPTAVATDSNGCTLYLQGANINIEPQPTITISNINYSTCNLNNGGFTCTTNGTNFIISNPTNGYSSSQLTQTNLEAGNYFITTTSAAGCTNTDTVTISNITQSTNIMGTIISAALLAAGNAQIELYGINDAVGAMNVSATSTTDATGVYSFSNLTEGYYLMRALPDTSINSGALNTYYNHEAMWQLADTIHVSCLTGLQTIDMVLFNTDTANGNAIVSGNVSISSFNRSAIGDAIIGASVLLHNNISNTYSNITNTDNNGNYQFTGVAAGNYSVLIDVAGLQLVTAYTLNIQQNQIYSGQNFYVDTLAKTIDTIAPNITAIPQIEPTINNIIIYPNPSNGVFKLLYTLNNLELVNIELFDLLGSKISTIENSTIAKGCYQTTVNTTHSGIYFLKIKTSKSQKIIKIISNE